MIVGVGIDVVGLERFSLSLERTPSLRHRLFTPAELVTTGGRDRSAQSLAARFAAKEAVAKALGAPGGMSWQDCEVVSGDRGRPHLRIVGTVAVRAQQLGITHWHVSLTHDDGVASAVVMAEARPVVEDVMPA